MCYQLFEASSFGRVLHGGVLFHGKFPAFSASTREYDKGKMHVSVPGASHVHVSKTKRLPQLSPRPNSELQCPHPKL